MYLGKPLVARIVLLLAASALVFGSASSTMAGGGLAQSPKIDKRLSTALSQAGPRAFFKVLVKVRPVVPGAKRSVKSLRAATAKAQGGLASHLAREKASGDVKKYKRFWLANIIAVRADAAAVERLAAREDVVKIFPDFKVSYIRPVRTESAGYTPAAGNEWNIDKVGAPSVWPTADGSGTRVAVIDTGIDADHPDLAGKVETDTFSIADEWGDVTTTTPQDTDEHGTHVSGTVAGGNSGGTGIGVAPGAKLMGVIALPEGMATFAQVLGAMQHVADPDGNPATHDQPDVANMSFGGPGLTAQMYEPIDNMRLAGVFPVVAAGNWPGEVGSPGDVPTAFAVGATDKNDDIAWFSGGGEVTWYDPPHEGAYMKPDASAPGVSVRSSVPGGAYAVFSGTSMATPHTAGAAALLRSIDASLTSEEIGAILQATALDLGDPGPDTSFGSGRIDVAKAAELATAFGTIEGTVSAAGESTVATVKIISQPAGTETITRAANGRFMTVVAPGDYAIEVSKFGYDTTVSAQFTLAEGETKVFSPTLTASARFQLSGRLKNTSGTLLNGSVTVLRPVVETTVTMAGVYRFRLPNGDYSVRAHALGYVDKTSTITVSGNTAADITLSSVKRTLLVIDWGASRYKNYFTAAMAANGVPYDLVDYSDDNAPEIDAGFLSQYKRIVWAAGDGPVSGTFPEFDWITGAMTPVDPPLASYLDQGGKLFVTGQDIAEWIDMWGRAHQPTPVDAVPVDMPIAMDFLSDYLHAELYKWKSKNLTVAGKPGTVFAGKTADLLGGDGADNQLSPDVVFTDNQSIPEFVYTREETGAASLRTTSGVKGTGKVVYLAFGLEGVDTAADRNYILGKGLNWLDAPAGALVMSPLRSAVNIFEPAFLSGQLTPKIGGEKIVIEQKFTGGSPFPPPGGGSEGPGDDEGDWALAQSASGSEFWFPITEIQTDGEGSWSTMVFPFENSTYRAVWRGNAQYDRAVSASARISVRPNLMLMSDEKTIKAGAFADLEAGIEPPAPGTTVRVWKRRLKTKKWRLAKVRTFGFEDSLRIPVRPQAHMEYRITVPPGKSKLGGRSRPVKIRVKHRITMTAETRLAPVGLAVKLELEVVPEHPGRDVSLLRFVGGQWEQTGVSTLTGGRRQFMAFVANEPGAYKLRARLPADARHDAGVSNSVSIRFY